MSQEYRPTGFSILPLVVKNLLIINGIMFLADIVLARYGIYLGPHIDKLHQYHSGALSLHSLGLTEFRPWQLLTYMFLHGNFEHLFFNMFALWMFGNTLENIWGAKRFLFYYLICGIGAGVISMFIPGYHVTVGASGAIYALLLAFGMMFPNEYIYLYFLVPIKTKWFIIGMVAIELFEGLFRTNDGIGHFAHLGGMLIGLIIILVWKKKGRLYY